MRFFHLFIILLIVVFLYSLSLAGGLSYSDKQELRDAGYSYWDIQEIEENMEYKYESSSGTKYKYDLSDPFDRQAYRLDPFARQNDRINPDPYIDLDRRLGEYGGGAKW